MTTPYAPQWLAPSAGGQLTNKRGSNTGADSIIFKAKYTNPRGAADLAGSIRAQVLRTVIGGAAQPTPSTLWDSLWAGVPATNPYPNPGGLGNTFAANCTGVYNGRLYVAYGSINGVFSTSVSIFSAPLAGANVGPGRPEAAPVLTAADAAASGELGAMQIINGRMYIAVRGGGASGAGCNSIYVSTIQGDGTMGPWTSYAGPNTTSLGAGHTFQVSMIGYGDSTLAWLIYFYNNTSFAAPLSLVDGSIGAWGATTAPPQTTMASASLVYSRFHGKLFVIGGGAGVTTVAAAAVTPGTGALGAFANNATGLPLGRANAALAILGDTVLTSSATVFIMAGGGTTVYFITTANLAAGNVAWTTGAAALPSAAAGAGFTLPDKQSVDGTSANSQNYVGLISTGGAGTVWVLDARGSAAALSGASTGLTAAMLQTGGVLTLNGDGSQDVSFAHGAFGGAGGGGGDGDQCTIQVAFTDLNGDASIFWPSVFRIGQPPTLGSVLPAAAIATGRPTASFQFLAGAGGGAEVWWRVQVKNGATVIFDTGNQYNQLNSVLINPFPLLSSGVAYTFIWTAQASDDVFNGATSQVSTTLAVTPTIVAVPGAPTTLVATPDQTQGLVALTWVNPAPPATPGARVYWRVNGTATWIPLKHNIGALAAFNAMDEIPLNTAVDFAVSQLALGAGVEAESALSNVASNITILPYEPSWGGTGFTAMLHVAGNGPAQHAGLILDGPDVTVDRTIDTVATLMIGATAPVARFGKGNYRTVKATHVMRDSSAAVDAMVDAARLSGATLYFRDKTGVVVPCVPATPRPRSQTYWASRHAYLTEPLQLVEVAWNYAASAGSGLST